MAPPDAGARPEGDWLKSIEQPHVKVPAGPRKPGACPRSHYGVEGAKWRLMTARDGSERKMVKKIGANWRVIIGLKDELGKGEEEKSELVSLESARGEITTTKKDDAMLSMG